MTQDIEEAVIRAVAQQKRIDVSGITVDSTLESLGISSLDAITIIYEIEEMFDVEVPNDNLDGLKTVQDIVNGVSELIASKG
jgi:acyl carrier protein